MSLTQESVRFFEELNPGTTTWNIEQQLRFRGALDVAALAHAVREVQVRHECLSARIAMRGGEPVQERGAIVEMGILDLRGLSEDARQVRHAELKAAHAKPFDLQRDALFRVDLEQLSDHESLLWITIHHIIVDGEGLDVLARELRELYAAHVERRVPLLPPVQIQYADYAAWQRTQLTSEEGARRLHHVTSQLAGLGLVELPSSKVLPTMRERRAGYAFCELAAPVAARLRMLCEHEDATVFMGLLAAFNVLLARYSGGEDIAVGTPAANRVQRETRNMVGMFINAVVLRTNLAGASTFADVLGRVREVVIDALSYQDVPFELVAKALRPTGSAAVTSLYNAAIILQSDVAQVGFGDLVGEQTREEWNSSTTMSDLRCIAVARADGSFGVALQYDADLFEHATIEQMARDFQCIVERVTDDPRRALSALSLDELRTDEPEHERTDLTLAELFEAQVDRTPDAIAVALGDHRLTYRELDERANRIAHVLRVHEIGPEAVVGVALERSLDQVASIIAVAKAGGAWVPMDAQLPIARLRYTADVAKARVVLANANALAALGLPVIDITQIDAPATRRSPGVTADGLAYVIFTSGSTGEPKGVMVTHRGIRNELDVSNDAICPMRAGEALLALAPYTFDQSVHEMWWPLVHGGTLVLVAEGEQRDPERVIERIQRGNVTVLELVPTLLRELVSDGSLARCPSLRIVAAGGEALTLDLMRAFHANYPGLTLINGYGPTESAVTVSNWRCAPDAAQMVIGRAWRNVVFRVLDRHGIRVPRGVAGELFIGGLQLARGYASRPDLTAERFVPDPFATQSGRRMYRTGDRARELSDGTVEFLGRVDMQVKLRGVRMELGEIEARLVEHPLVDEAAVIIREDITGNARLVAYVHARAQRPDVAVLEAHLATSLPAYMVPSVFVMLDAFPLTSSGKLDRNALPAPDVTDPIGYVAPRTEHEVLVASIWSKLLGVERVGVDDNFFRLGGHSLLAMRVIGELKQRGLVLEARALFATPTVEAVAAALQHDRARHVPASSIAVGASEIMPAQLPLITLTQSEIDAIVATVPDGVSNIQDIYALSPLQEGMLFHHHLATEGDPYLVTSQRAFPSRAVLDQYVAALRRVVDRHDALRTSFCWEGLTSPAQVVWRSVELPVDEVELDADPDAMRRFAEQYDARRCRLDLSRAPLLRVVVAREPGTDRWHAIEQMHHLVTDHETLDILHAEIAAIMADREASLPPSRPFRDLIADVRFGEVGEADHERYFRARLGNIDESTAPFGLSDARVDGTDMVEAYRRLPDTLTRALRAHARRLGVSVATLLHIAWAHVVARTSGREHVVFGTVVFGRMHVVGTNESAVGLYMNTLPIRIDVDTLSVEALVRDTQTNLAELMRHEHASLAVAQKASGVPAGAPLFSSLLNYRHVAAAEDGLVEFVRSKEYTNYPIALSVNDARDELSISVDVAADSVAPDRVCAMVERALETLVNALAHAPHLPMHALETIDPAEHARLAAWNATARDVDHEPLVIGMIEAQVDRTPDAIALRFAGASLTYRELDARVNQLAHELLAAGAGRGHVIGVRLQRSPAMVISVIAIMKTGAAYVPIDPDYPDARVRAICEASGCALVVDEAWLAAHSGGSTARPGVELDVHDVAYTLFTSGSTGTPKGAVLEHAGLRNRLLWSHTFGFTAADRFVLKTPFTFDVSVFELLYPFIIGACLVVAEPDGHLDPRYLVTLIREERVTYAHFVPSMLGAFVDEARTTPCPTLRRVMCTGEALPAALVREAARVLDVEIYNLYGPTEATVEVSWWRCDPASRIVPIGVAAPNTRMYVLDRHVHEVPIGVAGELYLAGVQLARGYASRPDLTAERFVPDPFHPGERMYRTGDLSRYLPDGAVEYLGRLDHQVKLRGQRIELGEIESVLRTHAGVGDAVVIVREDVLVAYVVPRSAGEVPAIEELQATLRAAVPDYMVPAVFVSLAVLPITSSGKLDRKALPAPNLEGAKGYVAPRNELETGLAEIWSKLLRVERVGVHDDFFTLGGHSLLAIRLVAEIDRRFGMRIPLRELFADSTLAGLAARAGRARVTDSVERPALRITSTRRTPLPAALRGVFKLNKLMSSDLFARHVWSVWIDGPLDVPSLERALAAMRVRHALLRTRFFDDKREMLEVLDPADVARFALLERTDLSSLPAEQQERADAEFHRTASFRTLDLGRGEVMSVALSTWSATRHRLTVSLHNIVSDAESTAVYVDELCELWRAFAEHAPDPAAVLPPVGLQYHHVADYLERLRESDTGRSQRSFWKARLEGLQPLQLPIDSPREDVDARRAANAGVVTFRSRNMQRALSADALAALEDVARSQHASVMTTLVAAMSSYLSQRSSQRDIALITRLSHRHHPGLERTLGFLVNPILLRVSTEGELPFPALVARTHTVVTDAFDHGECDLFELAPYDAFRFCLVYTRETPSGGGLPQLPDGTSATRAPHPGASSGSQIGYDLLLWLTHSNDRIVLTLAYNLELFQDATADAFLAGFVGHVAAALGLEAQ
ncbi:MAG TPA: amino acid adenylation domain-containing protein [Kofleriaceae bacterium]